MYIILNENEIYNRIIEEEENKTMTEKEAEELINQLKRR